MSVGASSTTAPGPATPSRPWCRSRSRDPTPAPSTALSASCHVPTAAITARPDCPTSRSHHPARRRAVAARSLAELTRRRTSRPACAWPPRGTRRRQRSTLTRQPSGGAGGDAMPHASVNGVELFYEVQGTGQPVLFIHGGYGGAESAVVPKLPPEITGILPADRFQVITYDRRNAGQSEFTTDHYTIDDLAADALALLDHIGAGRTIIVGSSA